MPQDGALTQTQSMGATALQHFLYLGCNSSVPSVSGDGQFQGAAVFEALVERGFKLEPDSVGVILLGLGLVAAHHLLAKGYKALTMTTKPRYQVFQT